MSTNVLFKIFVILVSGFFVGLGHGVQAGGISIIMHQLPAHTLIPVRQAAQITPDFLPTVLDTLHPIPPDILYDSIPEGNNDIPLDTRPRQSGSGNILDQKVEYSAKDSIRFDITKQMVHLYGNADMKYGDIHLTAAYINIDFRKRELLASGAPDSTGQLAGFPVFKQGEQNFESKELRYNFETKKGRTTGVITEEADGFLHGDIVKMMENRVIHVQSGKYTTCDDPNPHFYISFGRAKLIPGNKIITGPPRLSIAGVKTPLILPFGYFPSTRTQANGILMPTYGETENRGFYLENGGFYMGINDYMDLSLRGDVYSRGSWAARVGSTYKVRYKYAGSINLSYAINILGERNLPGYERSRDFRVMWNHSQDPNARPNSVFRANVNAGSSQYNRFNPTTSQDYLSNTFSSSISYSASWASRYNISVNARHSQNTITKAVDMSLPDVTFSVARFYPLRRRQPIGKIRWYEEITMSLNSTASNQIRIKEEELFTPKMFADMKNGVQHSVPISHSFKVLKHFTLSNSMSYSEKWFFQKLQKDWVADPVDPNDLGNNDGKIKGRVEIDTLRGFWATRDFSYSSSVNTRFYGLVQFKKGPVMALRHVVSPNIGFSFRPDFADPFWGIYSTYQDPNKPLPDRYSHFDIGLYRPPSPGRSGALNFSMSNNLEMKVKSRKDTIKGERKIALIDNLSVSSSYDFARDSLNLSDLRVGGRTRLFGQFDITYGGSWTPYATDTLGRPINTFLWQTGKQVLKLRNSSWSLNFNYNLSSKQALKGPQRQEPMPGFQQMNPDETLQPEQPATPSGRPPGQIDYSIPWSLRFSYSLDYGTNFLPPNMRKDSRITQSLTFQGDFNLTPNWRFGFSSGYNFEQKEFTYTSFDIYRDLHCWELVINWIPFGFRQSYNMTLRVKASVLQDLKYERRTHHLDRAFQ